MEGYTITFVTKSQKAVCFTKKNTTVILPTENFGENTKRKGTKVRLILAA